MTRLDGLSSSHFQARQPPLPPPALAGTRWPAWTCFVAARSRPANRPSTASFFGSRGEGSASGRRAPPATLPWWWWPTPRCAVGPPGRDATVRIEAHQPLPLPPPARRRGPGALAAAPLARGPPRRRGPVSRRLVRRRLHRRPQHRPGLRLLPHLRRAGGHQRLLAGAAAALLRHVCEGACMGEIDLCMGNNHCVYG